MKIETTILILLFVVFIVLFAIAFVIYPYGIGEKVLFGKHPPREELETKITNIENEITRLELKINELKYTEPMVTEEPSKESMFDNIDCVEYASEKSDGVFKIFEKELEICNNR